MNILRLGFVSIILLSLSARADVICNACAYRLNQPATYVGAYWPGDKGSFVHRNIASKIGQNRQFDNYFVFDLNQTVRASLVTNATNGTAFATPWSVEIFPDTGSVCDTAPGSICSSKSFSFDAQLAFKESFGKRAALSATLTPGRYVIRIAAGTRPTGETSYKGQLTF